MSLLNRMWQHLFADKQGLAQQALLSQRIAPGPIFGDLQLKICRYGPMLFSGPIIGKSFELYGQYSESEVALMRHFVTPGSTVLDIGANIGDLTVPLAQMVGEAGAVYAFESNADVFNILCANLALNRLGNVKPCNEFVRTRRAGNVPLAEPDSPYLSRRWTPRDTAIDELGLRNCSLIKIDVDGVEEDVLRSGEKLLRAARPVLYVENDLQAQSPGLLRYMDSQGYDLYWHAAPVFDIDNFFGNRDSIWPGHLISLMVLGIPAESGIRIGNLPRVRDFDQFWDFEADWVNDQVVDNFSVQVLREDAPVV